MAIVVEVVGPGSGYVSLSFIDQVYSFCQYNITVPDGFNRLLHCDRVLFSGIAAIIARDGGFLADHWCMV